MNPNGAHLFLFHKYNTSNCCISGDSLTGRQTVYFSNLICSNDTVEMKLSNNQTSSFISYPLKEEVKLEENKWVNVKVAGDVRINSAL